MCCTLQRTQTWVRNINQQKGGYFQLWGLKSNVDRHQIFMMRCCSALINLLRHQDGWLRISDRRCITAMSETKIGWPTTHKQATIFTLDFYKFHFWMQMRVLLMPDRLTQLGSVRLLSQRTEQKQSSSERKESVIGDCLLLHFSE